MELHVNAVEASELPNREFLGQSDTYLALQVTGMSSIQRTNVIENSQNPIWNQEFHFQLREYAQQKLICSVQAKSVSEDACLGTIQIPLNQFNIGEISDKWYKLVPSPGLKGGSTVRIVIQIAPIGHPAFQPFYVYNMQQQGMYQRMPPGGTPQFQQPPNPQMYQQHMYKF